MNDEQKIADLLDGEWHDEKPHHAGLTWPLVERMQLMKLPPINRIRLLKVPAMTDEQNKPVRSRDEQIIDLGARIFVGMRNHTDSMCEAQRHIEEAEARGAAEQRRKDAEGQIPSAYVRPNDFYDDERVERFGPWTDIQRGDFTIPLYTHPANVAALEDAEGYLFSNPDTGTEYLPYHPIESGECQYAENIRKATNSELLSELQVAWRGWEEDRAGKAALEGRIAELEGALKEIIDTAGADCIHGLGPYIKIATAALTRTGTPS